MKFSKEISPSFENSIYKCLICSAEIDEPLTREVKCPQCGGDILVYTVVNGVNRCLRRKYVSEIVKWDTILLRSLESYDVLDIQEIYDEDDIYRVALKGYRVVNLKADDWVDTIWGTWREK
ncbi:MAG: DNA directed RNA polymerase, 7 kDa subunit [Bacteriophage sp.]|nr:MAG: DNA directed RNA polymerase, 7 kDa subunit [Bacteriophage sp.]